MPALDRPICRCCCQAAERSKAADAGTWRQSAAGTDAEAESQTVLLWQLPPQRPPAAPGIAEPSTGMAFAAAFVASLSMLAAAFAADERFKGLEGDVPTLADVHAACPGEVAACERDAECRELLSASFEMADEPPAGEPPSLLVDVIQCFYGSTSDGSARPPPPASQPASVAAPPTNFLLKWPLFREKTAPNSGHFCRSSVQIPPSLVSAASSLPLSLTLSFTTICCEFRLKWPLFQEKTVLKKRRFDQNSQYGSNIY